MSECIYAIYLFMVSDYLTLSFVFRIRLYVILRIMFNMVHE